MLDEEVGAASEERRVGVFIQLLRDELQRSKLLGGERQLQRFGDVTGLEKTQNSHLFTASGENKLLLLKYK